MSELSPAADSVPAPDTSSTPVPDAIVEDVKPDTTSTAPTTTTATSADGQADAQAEAVTGASTTGAPPAAAEDYPIPLPSAEQHLLPEPTSEVVQVQESLEVHEDAPIHEFTGGTTTGPEQSAETTTSTAAAVTTTTTDNVTARVEAPVVKDIHDDILALSEQDMEMANRSFNEAGGGGGEGFLEPAPSPFHTDFDTITSNEQQQQQEQQQQEQQQQSYDPDQVVGEDEAHNVHDPIPIPGPVPSADEESQSHFSQMGLHTPITIEGGTSNVETAPPLSTHDQTQAQSSELTLSPPQDITSTDFFSTAGLDSGLSSGLPAGTEPFSMAPSLPTAPAQTIAMEPTSTGSVQTALLPTSTQETSLETASSVVPSSLSATQPGLVAQTTAVLPQYDHQPEPEPQRQPQTPAAPAPAPPPPPPSEPARIPHPIEQLQHYQPSPVMAYQTTAPATTTMLTTTSALPAPLPTQTQAQPDQSITSNYQYQPSSQPLNLSTTSSVATLPQTTISFPPSQSISNTQHHPQQAQQVQPQQASIQRTQQQPGPSPSQVPLPLMGTIQLNVAPAPVQNPTQGMGHFYTGVPGTVTTADSFRIGREPNRLLSGGRAKKEVKRRTKTGCLTCRKRRIKCDERHPVCRNCEKSKRECLGYDPVFRSQTTSGNTTLHPAPPSQSPSISGLSPIQSPQYATQHILIQQSPTPIQPIQLSHQQQQVSQPLHQQLQQAQPVQLQQQPQDQRMLQTPVTANTTTIPQHSSSQQAAPPPPPPPPSQPSQPSHPSHPPVQTFDYTHPDNIKALANAAAADPPKRPPANMLGVQELRMRHVRIQDLLSVRGHVSPLPPEIEVPLPRVEEIKMIYMSYANGIDKFLECHWFETKGLAYLLENKSLLSQYSALLDGFNDRNIHDPNVLAQVESREASVIWNTFTLCRSAHARILADDGSATPSNNDPELLYAVKRLSVIETMLTGSHLETNPVDLNSYPESDPTYRLPGLGGQIKIRELEFWQSIGRFLVFPGDDDPNDDTAQREKEAALLTCRGLLDTFENRDVIYSIAIARHIAKFQPGKIKTVPATADERDASSKLYVACRFLEDESRGKGTNQVIKRVAGMIVKYWEDPALMM